MRRLDIPLPLVVLAARQEGLVSTAQCDDLGFDRHRRRRLVASGRARRIVQDVLDLTTAVHSTGLSLPAGPDHGRRRAAVLALLACGPEAVAVGPCALTLLGVQGLPASIRPEIVLPRGTARRLRAEIVVRRYRRPFPTVRCDGFLVAAPVHAVLQAMSGLDRGHGIAVLDSVLQRRLASADELDALLRSAGGRHGVVRLRSRLPLADGRAQSPLETTARLQCLDAGIPADDLQVPIRDATGRVVARGDLGWRLRRGRWLVAEIDGAGPHGAPDALYADRDRQNMLVGTGRVDLLRFTAADLARRGLVPSAIRAHLAQDDLRHRR